MGRLAGQGRARSRRQTDRIVFARPDEDQDQDRADGEESGREVALGGQGDQVKAISRGGAIF